MKILFITFLCFLPLIGFSQFEEKYRAMVKIENPIFTNYDELLYEATSHVFSNPVDSKSKDFFNALKIATFWNTKDTGLGMPVYGAFENNLTKDINLRYYYALAMMHYHLQQKMEKSRVIQLFKVKGVKLSDLPEAREIQYEGAKIFINYAKQIENNFPFRSDLEAFIEANDNGTLKEMLFK
jgi:hypothetical protein